MFLQRYFKPSVQSSQRVRLITKHVDLEGGDNGDDNGDDYKKGPKYKRSKPIYDIESDGKDLSEFEQPPDVVN